MNNDNWKSRTELLLGKEKADRLSHTHILAVGLGGVGAYAVEQLARAGIGEMTLVDADCVERTNINRQLIATHSTIGFPKTEVLAERLRSINPEIKLHLHQEFLRDERTAELLDQHHFDYVIDAIDSLSPKVYLIYFSMQRNLPIISSMGAGGKLNPALIQVCDIKKTYQCRLAHALRKRLHKLGINNGFKAVFSSEIVPEEAVILDPDPSINKLSVTGTISYMPAMFGCYMASAVLNDLISRP